VTSSTFTGNNASLGGAIAAAAAVSVTNSTFTNNSSGLGGGAIFSTGGDVSVAYSTFTGNTGGVGTAIATGDGRTIRVFGSVFVKPAGADQLCFAGVAPTSFGYNYANETANSCNLTATGDNSLDTNDPRLGALANNGGPTPTQLPATGSPLLDAIPNAACQTAPLASGITADQRDLARPSPSDGSCDIGAVEVVAAVVPAVVLQPTFTG
jgi:predicted outer membrane repeat protein